MNNEINIAEILKDCPKGTKLYSPLFGDVTFEEVDSSYINTIKVRYNSNSYTKFHKTGLYYNYEDAECLLFPSSEMRDWKRFFKRGDIVYGNQEISVFESWADTSYTTFNRTLHCESEELIFDYFEEGPELNDEFCCLAPDKIRTEFIAAAEKYYHGKYNPDTLQVEPIKPEVPFNLKPFDKVLVRDDPNQKWTVDMFSYYNREDNDYPYICVGNHYCHCLPYNEQTAHLVGTKEFYNP